MNIWVKTFKNGRFPISLEKQDTPRIIKERLEKQHGVKATDAKLIFRGTLLRDEEPIATIEQICEHSQLLLLVPLRNPEAQPIEVQPSSQPMRAPNEEMQAIFQNFMRNLQQQFQQPAPGSQLLELPAVPQELLSELMDMGFPEGRAKRALQLNGLDIPIAVEWLVLHGDEPNIDTQLTPEEYHKAITGANPAGVQMAPFVPLAPAVNQQEDPRTVEAVVKGQCTYTVTQQNFVVQRWYQCNTCNLDANQGCCATCAKVCHAGHDLTEMPASNFYCDCAESATCKSYKKQ